MDIRQIESEALHLSREERERLIQRLVLSIEAPSDEQLKLDWLREARRRAAELDEGSVQTIPGDEVFEKARSLIEK